MSDFTPSESALIAAATGLSYTISARGAQERIAKIKADAWDELANALEDEVSFSVAEEYPNPYRIEGEA